MARSRITQRGVDITRDNGAILQSLIAGEQIRTEVTLRFFTSLHGATIRARLKEADNTNLADGSLIEYSNGVPSAYPNQVKAGGQERNLSICYQYGPGEDSDRVAVPDSNGFITIHYPTHPDYTNNKFQIIWDDQITTLFDPQPLPDRPVYAFFGLEVRDTGEGEKQQIYKPMRGLIELRYSVNW